LLKENVSARETLISRDRPPGLHAFDLSSCSSVGCSLKLIGYLCLGCGSDKRLLLRFRSQALLQLCRLLAIAERA
jgi:hypothetical protein